MEVFPGKDGIVRSALIKTVDGTLKRPVVKLAQLFKRVFELKTGPALLAPQKLFRKIEGKTSRVSQFQNAVKMCRIELEC